MHVKGEVSYLMQSLAGARIKLSGAAELTYCLYIVQGSVQLYEIGLI